MGQPNAVRYLFDEEIDPLEVVKQNLLAKTANQPN